MYSIITPRTENYFRDILLIFFARYRLIVFTALATFVAAAAIAFLSKPVYVASGSILLRSNEFQRSPELLSDPELKAFRVAEEDLRSERQILLSPSVLDSAIEKLDLDGVEFRPPITVGRVKKELSVDVVPASKVLEVRLRWGDPNEAVQILDAVLDVYIHRRAEILNPSDANLFFSTQVERFRSQLQLAKDRMLELAGEVSTPNPSKEIDANLILKQNIQQRLSALRVQRLETEQELQHLDAVLSEDQIRLYSFLENPSMADLSKRLIELSVERGEIARDYTDETRMVSGIDKQILETASQLRREASDYRQTVESKLETMTSQIQELEEQVQQLDTRNMDLQIQAIETESVQREVDLLGESFATFFKRQEESEIPTAVDAALSLFYVSILSPAHTSGSPVFPNKPVMLLFGVIGGVILGFTLGFIREFLDHRFKVPKDVEQFTGQRVLFSIPNIG